MTDPINQHFVIENISPIVEGGRIPIKRTVGDILKVEADIFRCGHEVINAVVKWRRKTETEYHETPMVSIGNDRWRTEFPLEENTKYYYTIAAWTDVYASFLIDVKKKVDAGQDVATEAEEGALLIEKTASKADKGSSPVFIKAAGELRKSSQSPDRVLSILSQSNLQEKVRMCLNRSDLYQWPHELEVVVDRKKGAFGSWYEAFIRSMGPVPGKPATFKEAEKRLKDIAEMGFDILYLAPFHPIGVTSRKGPNNSLACGPNDPGCPWAIGNKDGGHTSIDPALGTMDDFEHFVEAAKKTGLEVAMDFAVQCSPDHPWTKEHPEWFYHRPDGSIKFAENPPMKYEDICQINFDCEDWRNLWDEMKKVVRFWIAKGIRIFRVDNPHTKPTTFWEWLISEIQNEFPDVVFLSESLTRPKPMMALSKAGFTQSYTYFIWKNTKHELTEYLHELLRSPVPDYYRPNFFANTPDNLHEFLQKGGRPAFKIRFALAATLSPSYGIYSGYELCENDAIPGTEEYRNSEKYEIPKRDWNKPGHIKEMITRINFIRRENSAFHYFSNLTLFETDNDHLIAFGKVGPDLSNICFVVVNLDPFHPQGGNVRVPLDKFGIPWGNRFQVKDLLTGQTFHWQEHNFVNLNPQEVPVHIMRLER